MSKKLKEIVGAELASRVADGEIIGVGTGTTVEVALRAIQRRVQQEGLRVSVVPTSYQSSWVCESIGLTVLSPALCSELSWGFDGADEVDEKLRLIKGRGGAMLHEKIIAAKCKKFVVIVGEDKLVKTLGEKCPIPVEVMPEALSIARTGLEKLGATSILQRECVAVERTTPYYTQSGNLVLDVTFSQIPDSLEKDINAIPGVVENGLFFGYATEVLIGADGGVRSLVP
ncbi:MAG: ribose-5-phosphate isomerase RpiA [Bdellovibrionales bacterium]|nr:ribose-5-phosphate isomerase RpiA [Bdellovibrionales bacterium]